ncbi:MAG: hypothetical protein Q8L36_02415 [bacterium]|nr:hypothetical protein [bacterium]
MSGKKIIKIIGTAFFASFFLLQQAKAGIFDAIAGGLTGAIGKIFYFISYGILTIIGTFISGIAWLTDKTIELNALVINTPTVQIGWTICRDIANLGFVLILIIIALATVIRYQNYGSQKLLIKLIGVAIIVNFSLVIAGFILDFTNVLSSFFLNRAFGDGSLATGLASAFQPQKYLNLNVNFSAGAGLAFMVNSIVNMVTGIIFSLITAIILLCFAILFLLRFIWLTILLVVSPIAWLLSILPATSSLSGKWWSKFMNWAFFAPACLFFLYLAMLGISQTSPRQNQPANNGQDQASIETNSNLTAQVDQGAGEASATTEPWDDFWQEEQTGTNSGSAWGDMGINILNLFVFGGLMVGGLLAANSFSLIGAKAVVGAGKAASKAAGKWTGKMAAKYPAMGGANLIGKTGNKMAGSGIAQNWSTQTGIKGFIGKKFKSTGEAAQKAPAKFKESAIGKTTFTGKTGLLGSTVAGAKSGSGLWKTKQETKEKLEGQLNGLYTRKLALQNELDLLAKVPPANLNPQQQQRLTEIPTKIDEIDKKITEIEDKIK